MNLRLRSATSADKEFVRMAHHLAYRDVVERQFGWDEQQQDAIFDGAWSRRRPDIVEWEATPCGYAFIVVGSTRVDVHELVVHPEYQGRGIGTAVLDRTISQAIQRNATVYLQVLAENRAALRLYERLGFETYDTTETHHLMQLQPPGPVVRSYADDDLDAVLDVWYRASLRAHSFLSSEFLAEERRQIAERWLPVAETLVYEMSDRVVGFLALVGNEVGAIFVDPDHQGRGIGQALMNRASELRPFLELDVLEANTIGRRFYARYGFEVVNRHIGDATGLPELRLRFDPD